MTASASATDPRYMDVLSVLSRHGVRLQTHRVPSLIRDLLDVIDLPPATGVTSADGYKALHTIGLGETWRPADGYRQRGPVAAKNPAPGLRVCRECGETLPLERFGFNRDKRTGKRSPKMSCRACLAALQRDRWRQRVERGA